MSFISLFVLILHGSPSFTGSCIFLTVFLSDILSVFTSFMVFVQVFDTWVTVGLIRVLYNFSLVFQDRSLVLISLMFARYAWFAVMILE